jgi:hypothetical protein
VDMMTEKRTFSPEFRLETAELVVDQGYTLNAAAMLWGSASPRWNIGCVNCGLSAQANEGAWAGQHSTVESRLQEGRSVARGYFSNLFDCEFDVRAPNKA